MLDVMGDYCQVKTMSSDGNKDIKVTNFQSLTSE